LKRCDRSSRVAARGYSITGEGTSLEDIVGLCPNCHRSVHVYYKRWFERSSINDFLSKDEAREVYQSAKEAIQL